MSKRTIKRQIYDVLCDAAGDGLTCEQIELITGIAHSNVTGRLVELRRSGHVAVSPLGRTSTKLRQVRVYLAIDFADKTEKKDGE
jgi:hypothetical protein